MKLRVAIYCRLSEEDKHKQYGTDSESIQNQKRMLINYAISQNWEIYKIYSDDDYCGADRNRPAFKELLEDAEKKKFDIVLCKTQSRFTRELELVEKYIHTEFPKWGIRFIGLVDNADTDNKGNKKARQINGLVNEWYLEDMSDNIRQVLTDKRKNGYFIGAFAPYGYKKDTEQKGHLVIDDEAAMIVRKIYELYVSGYGKKKIAEYLNDLNIPNPTSYKKLHGERFKVSNGKTSSLWRYSTISDILSNEVYRGNLIQGKYGSISYKLKKNVAKPKSEWICVEHTHDAVIDEVLWNRVKELRNSKVKPMGNGTINIFANKLHCVYCGYTLRRIKVNGKYYYRCPTRSINKKLCNGSFISEVSLKEVVLQEFNKLCTEYVDETLGKQLSKNNCDTDNTFMKILCNQEELYQVKLKELYRDKLNGIIDVDMYQLMAKELEVKYRTNKVVPKISKEQLVFPIKELNRSIIDMFIEKIMVYEKVDNVVQIEIHWTF